jgi:hypothetical protein
MTDSDVYQLKITLLETAPPVWRRFRVPADLLLPRLHDVVQAVMGWKDTHLHQFSSGSIRFGEPDPEWDTGAIDYQEIRLNQILRRMGDRFGYEYDFGDDWQHEIVLERILEGEEGQTPLRCLEGERACPPEDCGGIPGYQELLEALADPAQPDHADRQRWVGKKWDPEWFDIDPVNRRLAHIRLGEGRRRPG